MKIALNNKKLSLLPSPGVLISGCAMFCPVPFFSMAAACPDERGQTGKKRSKKHTRFALFTSGRLKRLAIARAFGYLQDPSWTARRAVVIKFRCQGQLSLADWSSCIRILLILNTSEPT